MSALNMAGEDEGRTILVSGVPSDFSLEAIQSYFENKSTSNGGPIKGNPKRTQDFGRVIITFELEKDAENVVEKKVHNINKHKFHVNWFENLVWQNAMIVSNVPKDTSEEILTKFLETEGKLDIIYVFPGTKPGTFLVYCQNEIDFENVQKMCKKELLDGNPLKVDKIEEINSVQVKNFPSNVSSESLESYFGNKRKSFGGEISSIKQQSSDTYIVRFKDAFVVLDVCRMQHQLEGVKLNVQPFWEPSEENTISGQQVYDYVLPSKFHLTFLKKHRTEVNDQLKKWGEIIWKDSKNNKLKLNYSEEHFEEIEKYLKELLNSITVEIIEVPKDIFENIVGTFNSEADKMYLYFDNRNFLAHILGFNKSDVNKMKNRLLNNFRRKCENDLNIHEKCILSGLKFFEQAERQFEDLQITVQSNKVTFEGDHSKLTKCQEDMYKILQSIVKSELCLPLNTGKIINNKQVKECLDEKLRNNNCIGSWEAGEGDSVLLYASDKIHLSLLEEIMKQTFVANTLDFVDKIKETSNHGKWLSFVKSLKEEFPDSHFIGENTIVAVDAVFKDIKSKIDNFVKSLTFESMTHVHSPPTKELNDFSEKNRNKDVQHLEGTQNQFREKEETFTGDVRRDISLEKGDFRSQETLESGIVKTLGSMKLNSDSGSETNEILNFVYKNCEIVLREGDITTLDTDAIVNAANGRLKHGRGIAADIVQKGGFEIQVESDKIMERKSELKPGEVVSTKAGKLKCKTIIHAVGPVWNNGHSHELIYLSRAVENCLAFLEEMSFTSIAIPAISTGIFGIPIEERTKCTVTAVKNYLDTHSNSKIKHICLIDVRKEVIRAFKNHLETVFGISESRGTTSSNAPLSGSLQRSSSMTSTTDSESGDHPGIKIDLMIDSISNASVDVIVNSTNKYLHLDSGSISKFILNAAGPKIQDECNQKYPQGISTSEIAITKGYNLKCKNVFHLVLLPWDKNSSDSILANLTQIIIICLETAERMGAKSLAFPILGTEVLNYPIEKLHEIEKLPGIMYEAVKNYSNQNSSKIKEVKFVVLPKDTEIVKKFEEYFQQMSAEGSAVSSSGTTLLKTSLLDRQQKATSMTSSRTNVALTTRNEMIDSTSDTTSSNTPLSGSRESSSMITRTNVESGEHPGIKINLIIDSICNVSADVIINSTNKNLELDRGSISKFILNAASPQIQYECNQKYPQGISTSEIAVTKGYNLKCKNVFHLALPSWNENFSDSILANLTQIITICLNNADRLGAKSLAFPILGAGVLNYPIEKLPGTMYEAVKDYSNRNSSQIKDVHFVIYPAETKIEKKFREYFQGKAPGGSVATTELIPNTWSPMEDNEFIKVVPLTHGPEYDDIQTTFNRNFPSSCIIKIERIQNKTLYQRYQALKKQFEVENPNISNEVDGLWHGTAAESVDKINKYGFNYRYCHKNDRYGEGIYFAKDIRYSASDTNCTLDYLKRKRIYKCSVLAGNVMKGQQELKVLPYFSNSAVDNIYNPRIYVTFDDSQAYPNYLITFFD